MIGRDLPDNKLSAAHIGNLNAAAFLGCNARCHQAPLRRPARVDAPLAVGRALFDGKARAATLFHFRREAAHRFLVHDRDAIYAPAVDRAVESMGLRVLKTPVRTPQANAFCERLIGTMRRECLDWVIPVNERHWDGFFGSG